VLYLYLGLSFRRLLATSPHVIVNSLIAGAWFFPVVALIGFVTTLWDTSLLAGVLGVLISWYLIRNVRRLAREQSPAEPA
jgi:hypothetical protein